MSNSQYVVAQYLSPNHYSSVGQIVGVTPHCFVGYASMESAGAWFGKSSTQASCNYYIDPSGNVALIVPESQGSWCSSSKSNDMSHITIECASGKTAPYEFTDATYKKLVQLTADIYQRHGISQATWTGDTSGNVTAHYFFKQKECPGQWFREKLNSGQFCNDVNAILNGGGTATGKDFNMALECCFTVDGGSTIYYCDGQKLVSLTNPDQYVLINDSYKGKHGCEIPFHRWTSKAPWYNRLVQILNRPAITEEW